jgi:hypothetical protein
MHPHTKNTHRHTQKAKDKKELQLKKTHLLDTHAPKHTKKPHTQTHSEGKIQKRTTAKKKLHLLLLLDKSNTTNYSSISSSSIFTTIVAGAALAT